MAKPESNPSLRASPRLSLSPDGEIGLFVEEEPSVWPSMGAAVLFGRRLFVGVGGRVVAEDLLLHEDAAARLAGQGHLSVVSAAVDGLPVLNLCRVFVEPDDQSHGAPPDPSMSTPQPERS